MNKFRVSYEIKETGETIITFAPNIDGIMRYSNDELLIIWIVVMLRTKDQTKSEYRKHSSNLIQVTMV